MVKKLAFVLILISTVFAFPALAGDFTATVDRNSVAAGESFTLQLALSGAEAKGRPDTTPLQGAFTIASQGQSSNTTIVNGNVTNSEGWELTLIPRTQGRITIPSLSIETSGGTLSSEPITMEVAEASAAPVQSRNRNVAITAHASTLAPYKDQSVLYTVKILARGELANLSLSDLSVDNAVIQKQGEPRIYDKIENGEPVKVIEARYLITPVAAGKITIPGMVLHGQMLDEGRTGLGDPLAQDFADPFAMLRNMDAFAGFGSLKPFSMASNEVRLNVKPAAVPMDPWLPLTSLTLKEGWDDNQTARVGEPMTRKLTLIADGAVGKQLPSLEAQQNHSDFKIYADTPVTKETTMGDTIVGRREETYSLIPQKAGKLALPEIRVPWWNIRTNEIAYAQLPARTLDVLPALAGTQAAPVAGANRNGDVQPQPPASQAQPSPRQPVQAASWKDFPASFAAAIGILALALLGALLWGIGLRRKVHSLGESQGKTLPEKMPEITKTKFPSLHKNDISKIRTPEELTRFMRAYAHEHLGTSENASLETVFSALASQGRLEREEIAIPAENLSAAVYAGKQVNLDTLKEQCGLLIASLKRPAHNNHVVSEKLQNLNPS